MSEEKQSAREQVLSLRREAAARAEHEFKGAGDRRARHYARIQLVRNRRALQAQEALNAQH